MWQFDKLTGGGAVDLKDLGSFPCCEKLMMTVMLWIKIISYSFTTKGEAFALSLDAV